MMVYLCLIMMRTLAQRLKERERVPCDLWSCGEVQRSHWPKNFNTAQVLKHNKRGIIDVSTQLSQCLKKDLFGIMCGDDSFTKSRNVYYRKHFIFISCAIQWQRSNRLFFNLINTPPLTNISEQTPLILKN